MEKIRMSLFLLLLLFASTWAIAQQRTISGIITDADGMALPGATLQVPGTDIGTVTDIDGSYSISVSPTDTLIVSYLGYETLKITSGNLTIVDIVLEEASKKLDEIVVIGYGATRKRDLTGAISQISTDEFEQRNVSSLSEALDGTMPGVQVSSYSGAPGSGASVLIRGISSLNNNGVLWVVDGMPLNSIDFLNPQDIASVQVLKDASSAAIYGSQGANGVIIVETKKGKKGKMQLDFKSRYGIQSIVNTPSLADAIEYAKIQNQAVLNDGGSNLPYPDPDLLGTGTNWWDQTTQTAPIQDYYLGLTKGDDGYNISSSASYFSQDGVLKGGGYDRITFRLNTDFKVGDHITLGENFTFSNQQTKNGLDDYLVWDALRLEPVTPVLLPEYELTDQNEFSVFSPTITDVPNAMGQLARSFNDSRSFRMIGNVFAEVEPLKVLKFRSEFGVEIENWENNWFSPDYYIEETDKNDENSVGATFGNKFLYNWNNILTYTKSFGHHNLKLMGALTTRSDKWNSISGSGRNTPNNHPDLRYVQAATSAFESNSSNSVITYFSTLGRITYDYKNKYLLTSSIRRDGSSKFPTTNKYALFPSIAVGWVISEEGIFDNYNWLDFLKLRAAWGQIGNDNIPFDAQFATIDNYYYIQGQDQRLTLGKAPGQIGNTGLIWETVEDINLGLDAELFNRKIIFGVDVYNRKSSDMLMLKSLLSYTGAGFDGQWANIGSMSVKGFDINLGHENRAGVFKYNLSLNVTRTRSTMDKLADGEAIWEGNDQRLGLLTYTAEGGTVGAFYGFVTDGIFQSQIEVNNHTNDNGSLIQPTAKPGDFRFVDLNGDGKLTADGDRKIIGSPEADFVFGFNMGGSWKGIDVRALITGSIGNELLTPILAYTHSGSSNYNSYAGLLEDAWQGEGTSDAQPRIANIDANQNFRYSDYFISDGTYVRMKSLQIGYTLPKMWTSRAKFNEVRVFINAENLFTLTNYEGLDPDVGPYYNNILLRGVNWGNYPLPRIISFGLNATL